MFIVTHQISEFVSVLTSTIPPIIVMDINSIYYINIIVLYTYIHTYKYCMKGIQFIYAQEKKIKIEK